MEEGSIYGFLGPNGAGKTTTIKILMGLIFASSGWAKILGKDISHTAFKRDIGYCPESPYFYDYLKADEFLRFYADLFSVDRKLTDKRIPELLSLVGLADSQNVQLRKFSKGMLQRIGLAQALINDPKLLILDEPMTGLDPIGRKRIRDVILDCRERGKTVFFSSHILSDVEAICDQVSIIVGGQIVDSGYIKDLLNPKVIVYEVQIRALDKPKLPSKLTTSEKCVERGHSVFVKASDEKELRDINSSMIENGINILSIIPVKETLDDIFTKRVNGKR